MREIKAELADSFQDLALRMITSITDADIRKLDAYRRTLSGAVATDKMQLLRGEATSIDVSVLLDAVQAARDLHDRRADEAMEAHRRRITGDATLPGGQGKGSFAPKLPGGDT